MLRNHKEPISLEAAIKAVPALGALAPSLRVSGRYVQFRTSDILQPMLGDYGICAVGGKRTDSVTGLHIVSLRPLGDFSKNYDPGDYIPEVVISNSHNASSAYLVNAGMYRLVCSNGLMAASTEYTLKVRHTNTVVEEVEKRTREMWERMKKLQTWKGKASRKKLTDKEVDEFSKRAAQIRFVDGQIDVSYLVRPRRSEDQERNLWTVYNVIQENLFKGGYSMRSAIGRHGTAGSVERITKYLDYNKQMFELADEFLEV